MRSEKLSVVVLTCSELGFETADAVSKLDVVSRTAVVRARPKKPASLLKRLRIHYRKHGLMGTISRIAKRISGADEARRPNRPSDPDWAAFDVGRFEEDGLSVLESIDPDVAIVDGTYILPPSVFSLPHLVTINLHCGYLPDFKGAPPAFWELYEGVPTVGVTVHLVTADLDGGPIVARKSFPLDLTPPGDPMEYVERVWREVLRPAGIDMLCDTVVGAAADTLRPAPQDASAGQMFRSPSYRDIKELRRRVRRRRQEAGPSST